MPGVRMSFTVQADDFSCTLSNYAAAVQSAKTRTQIVLEQMKFAIRGIVDLTPPNTLAQGRQAVHTDLRRAMEPYGGEDGSFSKITNDGLRTRLRGYLRSGEYEKIKDVFSKIGAKGYYSQFVMRDFSEQLHHQAQNRRGRVAVDQHILVPQVYQWRRYLVDLQSHVGRARGGWTQSAEAVGLDLPDWVTRWRSGGAVDSLIEPGRVTFTFINRSIFIPDYREKVELALAGREKAMAEDLRRMYAGQATHAGFGGR